jgi:hypothetical protein
LNNSRTANTTNSKKNSVTNCPFASIEFIVMPEFISGD